MKLNILEPSQRKLIIEKGDLLIIKYNKDTDYSYRFVLEGKGTWFTANINFAILKEFNDLETLIDYYSTDGFIIERVVKSKNLILSEKGEF